MNIVAAPAKAEASTKLTKVAVAALLSLGSLAGGWYYFQGTESPNGIQPTDMQNLDTKLLECTYR